MDQELYVVGQLLRMAEQFASLAEFDRRVRVAEGTDAN